jgi:hypothetical protein
MTTLLSLARVPVGALDDVALHLADADEAARVRSLAQEEDALAPGYVAAIPGAPAKHGRAVLRDLLEVFVCRGRETAAGFHVRRYAAAVAAVGFSSVPSGTPAPRHHCSHESRGRRSSLEHTNSSQARRIASTFDPASRAISPSEGSSLASSARVR